MTELLLLMIPVAGFSVWFAEATRFPQTLKNMWNKMQIEKNPCNPKYILKRVKPFDCELCLAWWLGLLVFAFNLVPVQSTNPLEIIAGMLITIALAACTSLLAVFIAKIIKP